MATGTAAASIARRFPPGKSGNPEGRPTGTRNRFSTQFVADVAADWEAHGVQVLEKVRQESPERYLEICARLVPREFALTVDQPVGGLSPDNLAIMVGIIAGVRAALPSAEQRDPQAVLQFVADAINAASANVIENAPEGP